MISAFDLFKIRIGPSSSYTLGPMVAAKCFRDALGPDVARVTADLFGSLAWTGKGHGSDAAICLGMLGQAPATIDPDAEDGLLDGLAAARHLWPDDGRHVAFDPSGDIAFDFETLLPLHSNGMRCRALAANGALSPQAGSSTPSGVASWSRKGMSRLPDQSMFPSPTRPPAP